MCSQRFASPFAVIKHINGIHLNLSINRRQPTSKLAYRFSIDREKMMMLILSVKECFGADALCDVESPHSHRVCE
jgi:hypothetical protein